MNRYMALQHAVRAHGQDTDWGGQLYVLHPMAVAELVERSEGCLTGDWHRESAVIVALLHDVWEDTKYELLRREFTTAEWDALNCVTRWPTETYREYIEKIAAGGPLPIIVKLCDLCHNMSAERKVGLTEAQLEQAAGLQEKRYEPSRDRLWEALGREWWPV